MGASSLKTKTAEDWIILGRVIGTATGWDQSDTFSIMLYDFHPADNVSIAGGDVLIEFEKGLWEVYDGNGTVIRQGDLIEALRNAPRTKA